MQPQLEAIEPEVLKGKNRRGHSADVDELLKQCLALASATYGEMAPAAAAAASTKRPRFDGAHAAARPGSGSSSSSSSDWQASLELMPEEILPLVLGACRDPVTICAAARVSKAWDRATRSPTTLPAGTGRR